MPPITAGPLQKSFLWQLRQAHVYKHGTLIKEISLYLPLLYSIHHSVKLFLGIRPTWTVDYQESERIQSIVASFPGYFHKLD